MGMSEVPELRALCLKRTSQGWSNFIDYRFRSTDSGESWRPVGGELSGFSTVAVSPSDPRIVYAGVLEGDTATVYRSEDGGESWEARN